MQIEVAAPQRREHKIRFYAAQGREHAIKLLDSYAGADSTSVHPVDAAWDTAAAARCPPRKRKPP